MAFYKNGFRTLGIMGIPAASYGAGATRQIHSYITDDDRAAVETSNYFDALLTPPHLKKGDLIDISFDTDGVPDRRCYTIDIVASHVVLRPMGDDRGSTPRAIIPTVDGLTTGLIFDTDEFVEATSANAAYVMTLPLATAATRGREIMIWVVPSTACVLRTPATSNQTINNVDADGSASATLAHTQFYVARQHLATGWLLQAFTALGAVATAIVPA